MPLQPDSSAPGLWVNPGWTDGTPGVFALIIGISRYRHLEGGEAPAPDAYGLKQLHVSALTAYRFFDWLRNGYTLSGLPVARVRLLLSPQKRDQVFSVDELDGCDPAIVAHAPEANYANCKSAIENWYAEMEGQPVTQESGRSLFFFSGHGMELRQMHQFLLPSDYLRPPVRPLDESIGTRNLIDSLPYLSAVRSHVLFLDGCRNDVDRLRGRNVVGARILNDNLPSAVNPHYEQGVMSATASGLQAYQPTRPGSLTLFGQALMEGLLVKPEPPLGETPIELRRKGTVNAIAINPLGGYIKGRITALIKAANESIIQIVRTDVSSADASSPIDLAEVSRVPPRRPASPMVEEISIDASLGNDFKSFSDSRPRRSRTVARRETPKAPAKPPGAWFDERYGKATTPGPRPPDSAGEQARFDHFHDIFSSENITYPWMTLLRITGLSSRVSAGSGAIEIVSSARAEQNNALHRIQLHVRVGSWDPIGHVLTIADKDSRKFGCILPRDADETIYQIEIDTERDGRFIRFAAYLSPLNRGPAREIALAWNRLRALDASAAAKTVDQLVSDEKDNAEFVLSKKSLSPVGAAVASVLLLKGNQLGMMHDWTRNVANWFQWIPDGVVLWTEQCRRMARGKSLAPDLIPWFVHELSQRSLPFTADAMGFAADIIEDVRQERISTDGETRQAAARLGERIDAAMPYFRDDGMFCAYAAWPDGWDLASAISPPAASGAAKLPTRSGRRSTTARKPTAKKPSKKRALKNKPSKKKAAKKTAAKSKAAPRASAKRRISKRPAKRSRRR
jgi:hypothetical protein